jgi:hypothetical protein
MVYMSGSSRARNQSSITNRATCGGNKKSGLATYSNISGAVHTKLFCRSRYNNCYPECNKLPNECCRCK